MSIHIKKQIIKILSELTSKLEVKNLFIGISFRDEIVLKGMIEKCRN